MVMEGRDIVIEKNGGMDPMLGVLMSQLNKGEGFGGNSALLILALLFLGRGGLGGFGCGAPLAAGAAAAGVASCQDYLAIINAIGGVKESVSASAANTINTVDSVGDRVMAANVTSSANLSEKIGASTAALSSEITNLKDLTGALSSESSNRFYAGQAQIAAGFAQTQGQIKDLKTDTTLELCQGFSAVKEAVCNSSALINTNINNTFNALTAQNAAITNSINALDCKLSNQNEKTQGMIIASTEKILCNQDKGFQAILDAQEKAALREANACLTEKVRSLELAALVSHQGRPGNGNS